MGVRGSLAARRERATMAVATVSVHDYNGRSIVAHKVMRSKKKERSTLIAPKKNFNEVALVAPVEKNIKVSDLALVEHACRIGMASPVAEGHPHSDCRSLC